MKRVLLPGLLATAFSAAATAGGIEVGSSLTSGDVSLFENRQDTRHSALSAEQLQRLYRWLEMHRSGWHGMITEGSFEPAPLLVTIRHSDGRVTSLSVFSAGGGGHSLRLTGPGKWAYRSFGGIFKSWAATRTLSAREFGELEKIIDTT